MEKNHAGPSLLREEELEITLTITRVGQDGIVGQNLLSKKRLNQSGQRGIAAQNLLAKDKLMSSLFKVVDDCASMFYICQYRFF